MVFLAVPVRLSLFLPSRTQLPLHLKFVGDMLQFHIRECASGGESRFGVPALKRVEPGLEFFDPIFVQRHEVRKASHVTVAALKRPDGVIEVVGPPTN